jgi:fatty acid desaturase
MTAFRRDFAALGAELRAAMGEDDLRHLRKIERWGRGANAAGLALAWLAPNPLSVALLSTGRFARWAMVGHHVGHRGYDRVGGPRGREFAEGWRRVEWLDWLVPAAWKHEHNKLHHHRLNEDRDPDLVEANLAWLHRSRWPMWARYLLVGFFVFTWKWTYYAPTTLAELARRDDAEPTDRASSSFDPRTPAGRALWLRSYLPYAAVWFGVVPLLFLPLGLWAAFSVLVNSLLADALTNLHAFVMIVPNHAGGDLYRFEAPPRDRGDFFLRQILGSTNYRTGGDLNDFLHGFLNYQIEHHLWPDLSMLAYQRAQPRVKQLCARHGLPYVQESVFRRVARTVRVMVGQEKMRVWRPAPSTAAR